MKKFSLCIIAFISMSGSLFAHSVVPVSRWKTHEIKVDGRDFDWDKPINYYDGPTGMFFAILIDSSTLYLNLTIADGPKVMKLINAGWSLNFSTKNKKGNTKASIAIPAIHGMKGSRVGMMDARSSAFSGQSIATKTSDANSFDSMDIGAPDLSAINSYAINLRTFKANGFIFTDGDFPLQGNSGIVIRVGRSDPAGLLYEIVIPLKELYEEDSVELNELLAMSVSVNTQSQPDGDRSSQAQSEMPSAGTTGGGMPGCRMPGGRMNGENPWNASSASTKVTFKQSFRLSSH